MNTYNAPFPPLDGRLEWLVFKSTTSVSPITQHLVWTWFGKLLTRKTLLLSSLMKCWSNLDGHVRHSRYLCRTNPIAPFVVTLTPPLVMGPRPHFILTTMA